LKLPAPSSRLPAITHRRPSADCQAASTRQFLAHCVCVCLPPLTCASDGETLWSEKLPFAGYSVVKNSKLPAASYELPANLEHRCRGELHSIPLVPACALRASARNLRLTRPRGVSTHLRAPRSGGQASLVPLASKVGLPTVARLGVSAGERRLENTGLEPVTSWLQTRRSPS
jgi:hypothetical protein